MPQIRTTSPLRHLRGPEGPVAGSDEAGKMMFKRTGTRGALLALGVLVSSGFAGAEADAKVMYNFQTGPWKAGAYSSNRTGEFSHCAASARYKSGITLVFSVNKAYQWKMSFAKSSWRLTKGNSYPIRYRIDRRNVFRSRAVALNPKMAIMPLPGKGLFNQMRRGRKLYVQTKKDVLTFNLNGSSRMLASLVRCVKKNNTIDRDPFGDTGTSDPFGDAGAAADPFGEGTPARRPVRKQRRSTVYDDTI